MSDDNRAAFFRRTPLPHGPAVSNPLAAMAANPAPGTPEELLLQVVERLSGLSDQMRQTQADKRWAEIPEKVWETGNNPGATTGSPVVVNPMVGDTVFIERVIYSLPAGAVGSLTLGADTIPNLSGVGTLLLGKIVFAADVRQLVLTTGNGAVFVALSGYQLAPTGSMAP